LEGNGAEEETFTTARDYFHVILQKIKEYNPSVQVYIFLHKVDLLPTSNERQNAVNLLQNLFQEQSTEEIAFYETTIHDDSIKATLLTIFKEIIPDGSDLIEKRFNERIIDSVSQKGLITSPNPIESAETNTVLPKQTLDSVETVESGQSKTDKAEVIHLPSIPAPTVSSEPEKIESEHSKMNPSIGIPLPSIPIPPEPGEVETPAENEQIEAISSREPSVPSIPTPSIEPSIPFVSTPPVSNPSMSMTNESFPEVQNNSTNSSQLLTDERIELIKELFYQMQTALNLSTVSLISRDGGTLIHIGDNLEHFSETITIAHRVFKATFQQVPEGLAQLIIEMSSDSFVTVSKIDELFVLVTTGETPPIPNFSHELFEFTRKTAKHIQ